MRNLFDQYTQPENRLTHALLCCLDADRTLLQRFILWSIDRKVKGKQLEVLEQSLPGERPDLSEEEAEKRGLPDGCIWNGQEWALLIESKFYSGISVDQIRRHVRTAGRRGITDSVVLVLTVQPVRRSMGPGVYVREWRDVYEWLQRQSQKSSWAQRCRGYLEIADDDLYRGTLTVFSGIPFGKDEPFTYLQAKRLLGLLREELRHDRRLIRQLGSDPDSRGRGAITGRAGQLVWDFIGLKKARKAVQFTQYPHLTLGILSDRFEAYVTIPNSIRSSMRRNILGESYEDFEKLIATVTESMISIVRAVPGSVPKVVVVQRHYLSQRSTGVLDCQLRFDPRTAIKIKGKASGKVKRQPQWLRAAYEALKGRRSNLQLQVGLDFPYNSCPMVATRGIVRAAADVWLACRPLLVAATKGSDASDPKS